MRELEIRAFLLEEAVSALWELQQTLHDEHQALVTTHIALLRRGQELHRKGQELHVKRNELVAELAPLCAEDRDLPPLEVLRPLLIRSGGLNVEENALRESSRVLQDD